MKSINTQVYIQKCTQCVGLLFLRNDNNTKNQAAGVPWMKLLLMDVMYFERKATSLRDRNLFMEVNSAEQNVFHVSVSLVSKDS